MAGIIDGEGSISITPRTEGNCTWYQGTIRVHMSIDKITNMLKEEFGGKTYHYIRSGRHEYIWQVWTKQARKIAQKLEPYLFLKNRQAQILTEIFEIKDKKKRIKLEKEIKYLNSTM